MKYILLEKDKILNNYGTGYLHSHIKSSLDKFFSTHNDEEIEECQKEYGYSDNNLPIIWINDIADSNCMLMFEISDKIGSYIKLSFLGRLKG